MKKNQIFELIKTLAPSESYLALHGIADSSDIHNKYSNMSKIEKVKNILSIGLINARGRSISQTSIVYGVMDSIPNDRIKDINNYSFYSPSGEQAVIVISIPKYFEDSLGRKIYGGYKKIDNKEKEKAECISDYVFRDIIPPEMILGYYLHKDTEDEAVFVENPRYYTKLSQAEKDEFIKKYFDKNNYSFDVNDQEVVEKYKSLGEFMSSLGLVFIDNTVNQYKNEKSIGQL